MSLPPAPVLAQMARDAIAHHHDGQCGYVGHAGLVAQYERALDELEPQPVLVPVADPG